MARTVYILLSSPSRSPIPLVGTAAPRRSEARAHAQRLGAPRHLAPSHLGRDPVLDVLAPEPQLLERRLELVAARRARRVVLVVGLVRDRVLEAVLDRDEADELAEALDEDDSRSVREEDGELGRSTS